MAKRYKKQASRPTFYLLNKFYNFKSFYPLNEAPASKR